MLRKQKHMNKEKLRLCGVRAAGELSRLEWSPNDT